MKEFAVTVVNDPLVVDISEHRETTSVVCTPVSGTYTLEFSCSPRTKTDPIWVPEADLTAQTTQKSAEFGKITRLRLTLTAGTSVTIEIV